MSLSAVRITFGVVLFFSIAALPILAQGVAPVGSSTLSDAASESLPDAPSQSIASPEVFAKNLGMGQSAPSQSQSQPQSQSPPPQEPAQNQSTAPAANPQNKTEPSLGDLGFTPAETQANARQQALLDKRTHMLKIHQRMGLITTIPMIASVVTSWNAGGRSEGTAARDLHVALGALTGDLYGITAYYAIRAPKIQGTETRGPIKVHKILAWIHGPGMIATPILGAIAFSQKNNGQRVHGVAQAHGPVAIVTAGAFGAALLSVSVKF